MTTQEQYDFLKDRSNDIDTFLREMLINYEFTGDAGMAVDRAMERMEQAQDYIDDALDVIEAELIEQEPEE